MLTTIKTENKPENEEIENLDIPQDENETEIETKKKYSLNDILKSSSCKISKEKNYIWKNILFSEKFYEILTSKESSDIDERYAEIYIDIENILMGDFRGAKEKTYYYKDFYYVSYLLSSKDNLNNNKILFVVYYSKLNEKPDYSIEYLEFLEITDIKNELKIALNIFNIQNKYNNSDLEYDKHCFLDTNVFFSRIIHNNDGTIIRFPNENEIVNKSDKVKKYDSAGTEIEDKGFVDIELLIPKSFVYENVLSLLRKKDILDYDFYFKKKIINFIPSKTEKNLINKNANFILSGRPGTGKTFIILIKAVLTYLNCWAEHSKLEKNLIDWDYIRKKYLAKDREVVTNDNYKIIITSLSHVLCLKAEELFSQCMRSLDYNKEYMPSSLKQIENLESFQKIKKYPMFMNFRKIIFLIDGSLNFQFFDRPTNNRMIKRDNQCDIKYINVLEYDINYKINMDDIGVLNYF